MEPVSEEEVKLRGVGFVTEVGFKPGVKERGSYGQAEWKSRAVTRWTLNTPAYENTKSL